MRRLVGGQFPRWSALAIRPIEPGGWDNRTFRLGEHLVVRLPTAECYEAQVEKEHRWLPWLRGWLPLEIPAPLAVGRPAHGYPWRWSVYAWIDGDVATAAESVVLTDVARSLAHFLTALQRVDSSQGPLPGPHNFHRGGSLLTYDVQTRRAISVLGRTINGRRATEVWNAAVATAWRHPPVWIHGDVSAGNLLVRAGQLRAVIDFGMLGVGDPACDLSIAWTLFSDESREAFQAALPLDPDTWARGRGWSLWKALIIAAGLAESNAVEMSKCRRVIDEVLGG